MYVHHGEEDSLYPDVIGMLSFLWVWGLLHSDLLVILEAVFNSRVLIPLCVTVDTGTVLPVISDISWCSGQYLEAFSRFVYAAACCCWTLTLLWTNQKKGKGTNSWRLWSILDTLTNQATQCEDETWTFHTVDIIYMCMIEAYMHYY